MVPWCFWFLFLCLLLAGPHMSVGNMCIWCATGFSAWHIQLIGWYCHLYVPFPESSIKVYWMDECTVSSNNPLINLTSLSVSATAFCRASCTSRKSDIIQIHALTLHHLLVLLGTTEYIPPTPILLKVPLDCTPHLGGGTGCFTFYVTKSSYENLRPSELFQLLCSPFSFHLRERSPPSHLRKRCVL